MFNQTYNKHRLLHVPYPKPASDTIFAVRQHLNKNREKKIAYEIPIDVYPGVLPFQIQYNVISAVTMLL